MTQRRWLWECKDCGRARACESPLMALVLWLNHWAGCPKREA